MKRKLEQWDGKDVKYLEDVYDKKKSNVFIDSIIVFIQNRGLLQNAGTWLLKKALEDGCKISKREIDIIYNNLDKLELWESKLHILQVISYMKITKKNKKKVEIFLRKNLVDNNKFVRAWTYSGFYELAKEFSEYEDEVKSFLEMAMRDEAPSVKSRIRNILKNDF